MNALVKELTTDCYASNIHLLTQLSSLMEWQSFKNWKLCLQIWFACW